MLRKLGQLRFLHVTFVLSMALSLVVVYLSEQADIQQQRRTIQNIATGYISLIENNIAQAISSAYPIAAFIRSQNGDMAGFEALANEMLPFYPGLSSLQLQPDGIITKIVPLQGNERALGHNVFSDPFQRQHTTDPATQGTLTIAGPFPLKQGGIGAVARLPIYLEDELGSNQFWGFAASLLRFPDVLTTADLPDLSKAGYNYQLSRVHPNTGERRIFASSEQAVLTDSESFAIDVPGAEWYFDISPIEGWQNHSALLLKTILAFIMSSFITFLAFLILKSKRDHQELEKTIAERTEELSLLAHYDVLTQLPNRSLFASHFEQAISRCQQTGHMLAICFLDLDDFKLINDRFGHEEGDKVLVDVAHRLQSVLREHDMVSRQGGDEFILLLNDLDSEQEVEQLLRHIREHMSQSYQIEERHHHLHISYGVTLYPQDNADLDTLLRHADHAMYQSKLMGKNQYQFFDRLNDNLISLKHSLIKEVQTALIDNQLALHFQPKVNMATGDIFGAEALIRWYHPERGLIPPLDFLPDIENTALEIDIGGWVIEQAMRQLAEWQQHGIALTVSINISSHHLLASQFFDQIEQALSRYPEVPSHHLQLEILESSALGDINDISRIIDYCQTELGVDVALDDFGTGYSSLIHLRSLPASTIKIDQTFVRDLLDDPNDYTIIDGVIRLAAAFHRDIIAEGVETTEQGLMLLMMGCEQAQGYGISRPLPADDFVSWLQDYKANHTWLEFAQSNMLSHDNKLMMIKLTMTAWYQQLIEQLSQVAPKPYPAMKTTHLSIWIERFEQEGDFDSAWFTQLVHSHNTLFQQAKQLTKAHRKMSQALSSDQLASLDTQYDSVMTLLNHYQTTTFLSLFQSHG